MDNGENTKLDSTEEEQDNIDYIAKRKAEQERLRAQIAEEIKKIGGSNAIEEFFKRVYRNKGIFHHDASNDVSMFKRGQIPPILMDKSLFIT